MGLLDAFKKNKDKGQALLEQHGDKVVQGVDKATDLADQKTEGKYSEHLQKADDTVEKFVEENDNK
jgi:hypothetical protein